MFRLETPRLILREMGADDVTALSEVFSDPRVMASFPGTSPFDSTRMAAWVSRNLGHQREHGYGLFSVIHKKGGVPIGDCGLERMEIGVELGYELRLDRLVSLIRVGNESSLRVAHKVGMSVVAEVDRSGVAYWVCAIEATPR
ncbi:MAG: GNAT family N-acetyltransferase [Candidatus Limnocylindria bacterium]